MIEDKIKNKLYVITLTIDIFIIYLVLIFNLNLIDLIWCITVLLCHIMFIYALKTNYKSLIDFLHILVFALPLFTLFTKHIIIKIVTCALLFLIQILWIKEKKCILNDEDNEFGYGDYLNYYTLSLTILISFQIGHLFKFII